MGNVERIARAVAYCGGKVVERSDEAAGIFITVEKT